MFKRHAYGVLFLVNAGRVAWRGSLGTKHYTRSYHHLYRCNTVHVLAAWGQWDKMQTDVYRSLFQISL